MRTPVLALSTAVSVITLLLTACGGSGSGTTSPPPPKPQYIYSDGVVNGNAAVLSFPLTSTGTAVAPTVAASVGTADIIRAMATDGKGNLYVMTFQDANFSQIGLYVYSMSEGTLTLTRSFTNDNLGYGDGMTVTPSGIVYISIQNGPVAAFAANASGAALPFATYNVGLTLPDLATDASGNIYAQVDGQLTVNEYPAGFTSLTPIKTFTIPGPFYNCDPGIAVDSSGNLYVSSFYEIAVFAAGSTSATSTIKGTSAGLSSQTMIAPDSTGRIWVDNGDNPRYFDAFAAGSSGNVAPAYSFSTSTDVAGTWGTSLVID
jgi:hypothetical protein